MHQSSAEASLRFSSLGEPVAVIAEDEDVRHRIVAALEREGLAVPAAYEDAEALVSQGLEAPHTVTLAISDEAGPLKELRRDLPKTRIVVVVVGGDAAACRSALQAGADGIVVDSEIDAALGATARAVCANQVCIPRDMRRRLEKPVLSYRERQILGMVIMGFTNMEIAKRLYLAESTIKSHLSSAFSKLGVRSRNEASALILDPSQALGTGILAITDDERAKIGSRP